MNLRAIVLLPALLLAVTAHAATAPETIWQSATTHPNFSSVTNLISATPENFPAAAWNISYLARNGDLWLGGGNRVARQHRGKWTVFTSTSQSQPERLVAFAEMPDGRIWCATPDSVWQFDGRDWLAMRAGLEGVRALLAARDGSLWAATTNGLFHFTHGAWLINTLGDGLPPGEITSVHQDEHGTVFAESTNGWFRYEPDADTEAPTTEILSREFDHRDIQEDTIVTVQFRGRDKWDQTPPNLLLFSWRLDEQGWHSFQSETNVTLPGLGLGRHVFQARAIDHDGNVEMSPAELEFNVVVPWYRESRMVAVLECALIISLFFAALALNRHRKLRHSYSEVEKLVAERTQQLELANRELLHSQKMNALGTLAAGIAHDFNNILSIIKGSAQIIEDNVENPEKIRTRTARIQTVVQQGAEVVEAMLGFSRDDHAPAVPYDLNAVVADTRKLLGDRFLHETEVQFTPGENLPELSVPRDFVQQILLNFIFNADEAMTDADRSGIGILPVRSTPNRKQIILTTRIAHELPREIYLPPAAAQKFILISVRDFGSGIPPDVRARIFEPFFTTKNLSARRGTGLGLSMVYELAKKIGAGLAEESAPGAGSTFTLILPVRAPASGAPYTKDKP